MKKLLAVLFIAVFSIGGVVFASSVTTTDGQNFTVTDDGGYVATYTNAQIMAKISNLNSGSPSVLQADLAKVMADQQQYQVDHELFIVWNGIEQMAVNAAIPYANSQTNSNQ